MVNECWNIVRTILNTKTGRTRLWQAAPEAAEWIRAQKGAGNAYMDVNIDIPEVPADQLRPNEKVLPGFRIFSPKHNDPEYQVIPGHARLKRNVY